jgi:hypothetical protein
MLGEAEDVNAEWMIKSRESVAREGIYTISE